MEISYNWLKNYVHTHLSAQEVSQLLTDCGLEVESLTYFESIKGALKGIRVGEVLTCTKHPNADKLSVTTVNMGKDEILPIVCGAPNVAQGQKVLVATPGTILYSGNDSFEIKKSKIRGEVSEGMICAEDELQLGHSHDGIMVLDSQVTVGADATQYFPVETDYIFEIGLTPNRSDATSHIGVARDLVALINRFYPEQKTTLHLPSVENFKVKNQNLPIDITIHQTDACERYTGVCIENVEVKESPQWLKNRLTAVGLRPINNIVDVTNFVLMETGHPLHAFDYDKIQGQEVNIKCLPAGTPFVTLDGIERRLSNKDLMICDASEPMCMAGIFGGAQSGVSNSTKNIFLESAYFDSVYVRKSSKLHNLKTDASFRFERGADPHITPYALKRAAVLIEEISGGKIASDLIDIYPNAIDNKQVELNFQKIESVIGQFIEPQIIKTILHDLGITILKDKKESLLLSIPPFKVDVTRDIDLIEEILRIYGYNHIHFGTQIKSSVNHTSKPEKDGVLQLISEFLVANGFNEIMNNSLTKGEYYEASETEANNSIKILNPLSSELNVLRQSLLHGALESIQRNHNYKSFDLKLFEFGNSYQWKDKYGLNVEKKFDEHFHLSMIITGLKAAESWRSESKAMDFYDLKAVLSSLFTRFGIEVQNFKAEEIQDEKFSIGMKWSFQNKAIVSFGKVNHKLLKEFDIQQEVFYADIQFENFLALLPQFKTRYSELPKYPAVRRDLALLVDQAIQYQQIESIAYRIGDKLVKDVNLFDVYEGKGIPEGKKSYAISLILQDESKTLTDKIVDKAIARIVDVLNKELEAQLR
jgi:phenylalanyl-tRNA synthetase beta chain